MVIEQLPPYEITDIKPEVDESGHYTGEISIFLAHTRLTLNMVEARRVFSEVGDALREIDKSLEAS